MVAWRTVRLLLLMLFMLSGLYIFQFRAQLAGLALAGWEWADIDIGVVTRSRPVSSGQPIALPATHPYPVLAVPREPAVVFAP